MVHGTFLYKILLNTHMYFNKFIMQILGTFNIYSDSVQKNGYECKFCRIMLYYMILKYKIKYIIILCTRNLKISKKSVLIYSYEFI